MSTARNALELSPLTTDALDDAMLSTSTRRARLMRQIPSAERDERELRLLAVRQLCRRALRQRGVDWEVQPWETARSIKARLRMVGDVSRWAA